MKKYDKEVWVGLFVFVGLVAVAYSSIKLGNVSLFGDDHYQIWAEFSDISGLKSNANVQMLGVDIGFVDGLELDQEDQVARVSLKIRKEIVLHDDAMASIKTSGLIGDKYVKITPGGVGDPLSPGDTIIDTEAAIDLESLISKYVFGGV